MRILLIFICFLVTSKVHAQPDDLSGMNYRGIAAYYIKYLKNGALFVRLHTKSRKIAILERAGNLTAAEKVRQDQFKINKSIVKAFKESFTFCPVYFFYAEDSKFVSSYQLDSVRFLDDNLQPSASIEPPTQFLTAEFGIIQEDTAKNFTGYSRDYHKDSSNVLYPNKQFSGGTNMSFGALIIKSDQFVQLPPTFPYYSRNLATLPILRRSHSKVVSIMNDQLNNFWGRRFE